MFRGRYQHTIDPKGRVSIPAKFRDVLAQLDGNLVLVPNENFLEVHPEEEWERIEAKIAERSSMFDAEVRRIGHLYVSRAETVSLDGAGRILLPPKSRDGAHLPNREVTLVGPGRKFFEIWDRQRFDEYERMNIAGLPGLFDKLSALGI